jgi:electron transport complex protein RnfD
VKRQALKTSQAPHIPSTATVAQVMRQVLYALIPGILLQIVFFGPGVLVQIALATGFALGFEALMLRMRERSIARFLGDGSAVVTAVLFALCIPPLAPWWISAVAMLMAIVIAKHLYGGLGHNVFNPAMIGYVVVLISFPKYLTRWRARKPACMPANPCRRSCSRLYLASSAGWDGSGWQPHTWRAAFTCWREESSPGRFRYPRWVSWLPSPCPSGCWTR